MVEEVVVHILVRVEGAACKGSSIRMAKNVRSSRTAIIVQHGRWRNKIRGTNISEGEFSIGRDSVISGVARGDILICYAANRRAARVCAVYTITALRPIVRVLHNFAIV